jgi:CTP:molybdopterin cytidylyltransferase MocA
MRRIGVILAAGRGRRFQGTKQLAIWNGEDGPKPLVAAAYDAIWPICDDMVVVLGHEADAVAAALGKRTFQRAESDPDLPMFESIRIGLRTALDMDPNATIVLHPADHPSVSRETLDTLVDCSLKRPDQTVIPQFGEHGGHPALIPAQNALLVISSDCSGGLGDFWKMQPELCVRVPVNDATVLLDVDTPEDLSY